MAIEVIIVACDTKTVGTAGTAEALTTRDVRGSSVFVLPEADNTGVMYVVDSNDSSKKVTIPAGGLTLPVNDPSLISIDSSVSTDGVEWMCV